eukprot:sb/3474795/
MSIVLDPQSYLPGCYSSNLSIAVVAAPSLLDNWFKFKLSCYKFLMFEWSSWLDWTVFGLKSCSSPSTCSCLLVKTGRGRSILPGPPFKWRWDRQSTCRWVGTLRSFTTFCSVLTSPSLFPFDISYTQQFANQT